MPEELMGFGLMPGAGDTSSGIAGLFFKAHNARVAFAGKQRRPLGPRLLDHA
jgi:hypothetical protein